MGTIIKINLFFSRKIIVFIVTDNIDKDLIKKIKHRNIKITVIENSIYQVEGQCSSSSLMQFLN